MCAFQGTRKLLRARTPALRITMLAKQVISKAAAAGKSLTAEQVAQVVARACPADAYRGKRVLVIVPDATRTAPVGLLFQTLHKQIGASADLIDVIIALGTHQPMSESAICERLEISPEERTSVYGRVGFHNHEWNNPA